MAGISSSGIRLAGSPVGAASPDPFGTLIAGVPGQMTPGYTGGFDYTTISGIEAKDAALFNFLDRTRALSRQESLEDWERARQMRSEEGKEAAKIKMLSALPGQILQGFESIARLSYPAAAIEIARGTPGHLTQIYLENARSGKRYIS
jgi:hypothetical protein